MLLHDWATHLLLGDRLEDKLLWSDALDALDQAGPGSALAAAPSAPGRPAAWAFTPNRAPFPSRASLSDAVQRLAFLTSPRHPYVFFPRSGEDFNGNLQECQDVANVHGDAMEDPPDDLTAIDDEDDGDVGEEAEGSLCGGLLCGLVVHVG